MVPLLEDSNLVYSFLATISCPQNTAKITLHQVLELSVEVYVMGHLNLAGLHFLTHFQAVWSLPMSIYQMNMALSFWNM